MDEEVEEADALDMRFCGTTLTVRKILNRFEFAFENGTKIMTLGKNQTLNAYNEVYPNQNTLEEFGLYNDGINYQNFVKLKDDELIFESVGYLQHKQLKIKKHFI